MAARFVVESLEMALVSRVEAHIVSHFRQDREPQLGLVLDAMMGWKNCLVRAVITSNTRQYETSGFLARYAELMTTRGHSLSLNVADNLTNPRMLTWEHKNFLPAWIAEASPGEDFFLYIEDDIVLEDANLAYFMNHLRVLRQRNLIPGFLRFEKKAGAQVLVDVTSPEYWERDRTVVIQNTAYHANKNPYWAGYILDRSLAEEYVRSRSFSPADSTFAPWNIQERSAMGLTFENPPASLKSRVVIPIVDGVVDPGSLVWHCSDSYSAANHPVVARLTLDQAYVRESLTGYLARKAKSAARSLGARISRA